MLNEEKNIEDEKQRLLKMISKQKEERALAKISKGKKNATVKTSHNCKWIKFMHVSKVNSVQEACTKCYLVHIEKLKILQNTLKKTH